MQTPPIPTLIPWSELWLPVLTFIFGGSISWVRLWLNRKKPSAETEKTWAEARKLDADASAVVAEVVVSLSAKLSDLNVEMEAQRHRVHNAMDEVNRCVGYLKHYENIMSKNQLAFQPFVVKSYKDIVGDE